MLHKRYTTTHFLGPSFIYRFLLNHHNSYSSQTRQPVCGWYWKKDCYSSLYAGQKIDDKPFLSVHLHFSWQQAPLVTGKWRKNILLWWKPSTKLLPVQVKTPEIHNWCKVIWNLCNTSKPTQRKNKIPNWYLKYLKSSPSFEKYLYLSTNFQNYLYLDFKYQFQVNTCTWLEVLKMVLGSNAVSHTLS